MNPRVLEIVRHFADSRKPIAAHLPRRADSGGRQGHPGKRISAYPACSPEVELAGATYAAIASDDAVTDGNFVTAPAWPAHPAWIAQFLAVLGTRIARAGAGRVRVRQRTGARRARPHVWSANNSARVLLKCGFLACGQVVEPEDGLVWRWEKLPGNIT